MDPAREGVGDPNQGPAVASHAGQEEWKMSLDPGIAHERLRSARLYLILTRGLCRLPPEEVLRQALEAGVDLVQVREPSLPDRLFLEWIHAVRELSALKHVPVIVNDRPDLALLGGADGVHVGQEDLPPRAVRELLGPERIVGLSTHGRADVEAAGQEPLEEALPAARWPAFAIGGLRPERVDDLRPCGLQRVAVSSAVCAAEEPGRVVQEFLRRLHADPSAP